MVVSGYKIWNALIHPRIKPSISAQNIKHHLHYSSSPYFYNASFLGNTFNICTEIKLIQCCAENGTLGSPISNGEKEKNVIRLTATRRPFNLHNLRGEKLQEWGIWGRGPYCDNGDPDWLFSLYYCQLETWTLWARKEGRVVECMREISCRSPRWTPYYLEEADLIKEC